MKFINDRIKYLFLTKKNISSFIRMIIKSNLLKMNFEIKNYNKCSVQKLNTNEKIT